MSVQKLKELLSSYFNFSPRKSVVWSGIIIGLILIIAGTITYRQNTEVVPDYGGTYTEGVVGTPRFFNPIYASQTDIDRDITELLFAGLMKYDKDNNLVPHLAKSVETEDNKVFTVTLTDAKWSDGTFITTEDVIFTLEKIQNRDIQSPLRISWEGIKIKKLSDKKIQFILETPSPLFKEKLTLQPIPKHIWKDVPIEDFQFSKLNLNPKVSSGPYQLESQTTNSKEEIQSLSLTKNPNYFDQAPYIKNINFSFFKNQESLVENVEDLDGLALPSIKTDINNSFNSYNFQLPRYFALFFNLDQFDKETRKALAYGTNKSALLQDMSRNVQEVNSPIISHFYNLKKPETEYAFNPEKAIELLEKKYTRNEEGQFERIIQEEDHFEFTERLSQGDQGKEVRQLQKCLIETTKKHSEIFPEGEVTGFFNEETKQAVNNFQTVYKEEILTPHGFEEPTGLVASSTRTKLNELCGGKIPEKREEVTIEVTTISHPLLMEVLEKLKDQWKEIGINLETKTVDLQTIEEKVIREREFESFLFGVSMKSFPDPFRWWHSSQLESPGLNFTGYSNEEVDELLEQAIRNESQKERRKALIEFQNKLLKDIPAIFLYSPDYIFLVDKKVQGIEEGKIINTSQRFRDIQSWYIKTKRVWNKN